MSYRIDFTKQAQNDIDFHRKSGNKPILKKINTLLEELVEHPFTGTGKPELFKYDLADNLGNYKSFIKVLKTKKLSPEERNAGILELNLFEKSIGGTFENQKNRPQRHNYALFVYF